jgi:hypothetical protein
MRSMKPIVFSNLSNAIKTDLKHNTRTIYLQSNIIKICTLYL